MADHAPHEHVVAAPSAFTDTEIADLRANDVSAARAVVILMLGIFSTGVGIYSIVAYWVINFS